ncbi:MAG TPA: hypothetical protein VL549_03925 [Gemmatimonadales bacterium]|nr:hypothetical protein [Gemmatimonadales bacterium]
MTANKGRLAGALWLVVIVVSMAGHLVRLSAPRVDFAANLLGGAVYLGVTVLLAPFVIPLALLGEGSLTLWLLAKGVRA